MPYELDVPYLISRAVEEQAVIARAQALFLSAAASVFTQNHERSELTLRASDAGSCVLQLWAELHGKEDIPEDPDSLLKMMGGQLYGAWLACLLAAKLESIEPWLVVQLEVDLLHDSVPGHADVVICAQHQALEVPLVIAVVEFKTTFWTGAVELKTAHWKQSGKYALGAKAPRHLVVYYAPATQVRYDKMLQARVKPPALTQFDFDTTETQEQVAAEYVRLSAALKAEAPEADPKESWQCRVCKYSQCPKNENPRKSLTLIRGH